MVYCLTEETESANPQQSITTNESRETHEKNLPNAQFSILPDCKEIADVFVYFASIFGEFKNLLGTWNSESVRWSRSETVIVTVAGRSLRSRPGSHRGWGAAAARPDSESVVSLSNFNWQVQPGKSKSTWQVAVPPAGGPAWPERPGPPGGGLSLTRSAPAMIIIIGFTPAGPVTGGNIQVRPLHSVTVRPLAVGPAGH